jgi:predicted outer membrane lipoprotein
MNVLGWVLGTLLIAWVLHLVWRIVRKIRQMWKTGTPPRPTLGEVWTGVELAVLSFLVGSKLLVMIAAVVTVITALQYESDRRSRRRS